MPNCVLFDLLFAVLVFCLFFNDDLIGLLVAFRFSSLITLSHMS